MLLRTVTVFYHQVRNSAKDAVSGETALAHGDPLEYTADIPQRHIVVPVKQETVQIQRFFPYAAGSEVLAVFNIRSQDFRHSLLITGGAFAALIVLAFAVGLIFPAVPAQVLTLFSQQMADAGVVSESGSISVPALLWNNLRAMVLSVLYGFIPFIYLPALSLGVNALLLGLFAAYFLNNGISMLAYLGGHPAPRHL